VRFTTPQPQARTVEHLILGGSINLVAMGLVVGGGAALVLTQLMRRLLYGRAANRTPVVKLAREGAETEFCQSRV
jgi:hypothetical protein